MQTSDSKQSKLSENLSEKLVRIDNVVQNQEATTESKNPIDTRVLTELPSTNASTLTEDVFGQYWDSQGNSHYIKRFTWKNPNRIEVQVINYGARITSMKFPDRKGHVEDIILGFDDIGGYVYYKKFHLGATIGRVSQIVKDGEFELDKKRYQLTRNYLEKHHKDGGFRGLDQSVWNSCVDGKKVILSHMSPDMTEGYPGDLLVRITFELSDKNEFVIDMEAISTSITIINLSNLSYFNLAGNHAGPEEIYKHVLTLNCNCFTTQNDGIPTGEIMNVVHSEYDFQVPKTLGKVMGITPQDGFNQNLCINRGSSQDECFVGRVLHPPSGRMLEIYSNQRGVNFSTANEFGYGRMMCSADIVTPEESEKEEETLRFLELLRQKVLDLLHRDEVEHYRDLRDFIMRLKNAESKSLGYIMTPNNSPRVTMSDDHLDIQDFIFEPLHVEYLKGFQVVLAKETGESYEWLRTTIDKLLDYAIIQHSKRASATTEDDKTIVVPPLDDMNEKNDQKRYEVKEENFIPSYYLNSKHVVGKERKVYRMHGGIALQTQNYPNSVNLKNFPDCILKPGENYRHTLTYKFWIRAGNPNKWIKRNMNEFSQGTKRL